MRDSLKNLFEAEITIEDKTSYYYSVKPFELTNMLGNIAAILQEYNFTKKADHTNPICFKLYKTKEGNWYNMEEVNPTANNSILRALKLAINNDGMVKV